MGDVEAPFRKAHPATAELGASNAVTAPRLRVAAVVLALGRKHQAELADLHLVIEQHRRLHRLPVDVGAVEATDVHNLEFVVLPSELRL
jgi:hypothetical protein